jgi:hypothetical protein
VRSLLELIVEETGNAHRIEFDTRISSLKDLHEVKIQPKYHLLIRKRGALHNPVLFPSGLYQAFGGISEEHVNTSKI